MLMQRRGKEAGARNAGRRSFLMVGAVGFGLWAAATLASAAPGPPIPGTSCGCFPSDNIWNTDISNLPVHARSADWVNHIGASKNLDLAFGPPNWGMPWIVTDSSTPKYPVSFSSPYDSDPGPYPIGANTPIDNLAAYAPVRAQDFAGRVAMLRDLSRREHPVQLGGIDGPVAGVGLGPRCGAS